MEEIIECIMQMDDDEINQVYDALKLRSSLKQQKAAIKFRIGQEVMFTSRKGQEVYGKIKKINRKTIQVFAPDTFTTWNVSPSLLVAA